MFLQDRNDFAPDMTGLSNRNVQKLENVPIGELIEKLVATDQDTPVGCTTIVLFHNSESLLRFGLKLRLTSSFVFVNNAVEDLFHNIISSELFVVILCSS